MKLQHGSTARKSLPLSERDLQDLAQLRGSAEQRMALATLVDSPVGEDDSEASVLHAVVVAGLRAVRRQAEEEGYAQMAEQLDVASRRGVARRRQPAWADE